MQLSELRTRMNRLPPSSLRDDGEEVLIKDQRATLSPAQLVEQKFRSVLHRGVSFFSQVTRVQQS
jgi:hypothetical protein